MENLKIDLSLLPKKAQHELYDFYQFLIHKYASKHPSKKINITDIVPRQVNPFKPLDKESVHGIQ